MREKGCRIGSKESSERSDFALCATTDRLAIISGGGLSMRDLRVRAGRSSPLQERGLAVLTGCLRVSLIVMRRFVCGSVAMMHKD